MRRKILPIFAIVSIVLAVVVGGLMVRSYWRFDSLLRLMGEKRDSEIYSLNGQIGALIVAYEPDPVLADGSVVLGPPRPYAPLRTRGWEIAGFGHRKYEWSSNGRLFRSDWMTTIPHWALLPLFGISPWLWWRRKRREVGPGHCLRCGYDTRANPLKCSECGHEMSSGEGAGIVEAPRSST